MSTDPEQDPTPAPSPPGEPAANPDAGSTAGPDTGIDAPVCDICGAAMYELHCRLICPRCGYQRDCSDP